MSSLIGNRYGEAFFEAGRDENCLDSLYDDVRLLEGVLEDNDDFMKIMIMIRKIFLCLVIDMEQSKIFFQISGFLEIIL